MNLRNVPPTTSLFSTVKFDPQMGQSVVLHDTRPEQSLFCTVGTCLANCWDILGFKICSFNDETGRCWTIHVVIIFLSVMLVQLELVAGTSTYDIAYLDQRMICLARGTS